MKNLSVEKRFGSLVGMALVAVGVALLCSGQVLGGVMWLNGSAYGRYGSGNTTIGEQSVSGVALADDDTTGLQQAQNYHISAGSRGNSLLTGNAIAAAGGHLVASDFPSDPLIYFFSSGGGVQYLDAISVTSPTAPAGTMVTIQFSLHVAYSAAADHSLAGEESSNNRSNALGTVSCLASGWHDSHYVDSTVNNVVIDTYDQTYETVGLFAGTQHLDFLFSAEVGEEFSFSLTVDADTGGKVSAYEPAPYEPLQNAVGMAYSTVAVAYGASVLSPDEIELISGRTGGTFPSSTSATAGAAGAAMPENPYVPDPVALTVNSGSGSGTYPPGTVVNIDADPAPSGQTFDQWIGDTDAVANVYDASTTVTMPAGDAEVTATYGEGVCTPPNGDLDSSGFTGQGDLDIVLDQWGHGNPSPPNDPITDPRADPSGDSFVGQADLDIVLDDWGKSCEQD